MRATAIDLMQNGFPAVVPRESVGDRARAPHEANLFDIQAKYADVIGLEEASATWSSLPAHSSRGRNIRMTVPFSFVDLCAAELELCGLREGETVAVLSQMDERQDYADAFMAAALRLGATPFHVRLPEASTTLLGDAGAWMVGVTPLATTGPRSTRSSTPTS